MPKDKYLKKILLIFIILQTVVLNAKYREIQQNRISYENSSVIQIPKKNKVKTKRFSNGLTVVKCMLRNEMLTQEQAKKKNIPQNFIKNVRFFEDDKIVYSAILTPYISKNPILKFTYYGNNAPILKLETIDFNNKIQEQYYKINSSDKPRDAVTINKVKESTQTIKLSSLAIQKMFGNREILKSENIKIIAPDNAANPGAVSIKIQTNIKAKSVTLFATQSDTIATYWDIKNGTISFTNEDLALVYQYFVQKESIIDFDIKIKLSYGENSKVIVIVEAEDGHLYMKEKFINIFICIDSGG